MVDQAEHSPEESEQRLARKLAHMARDLLSQETVQDTLDRIVEYAVGTVDGCEEAGILTLSKTNGVRTLAATSGKVRTSDRIQGELSEGPCFDAALQLKEVYRIADMTTTVKRWPRYAEKARELGIGSMMGFLLYTDDDNLGALNIYSSRPNAFAEDSEHPGWLLASHAAVALASARAHAQLRTALDTRHDIGEAMGIIMERYKLSEDVAFAVLTKSSQERNIKLREVAKRVTETGEIPGAS